MGRAAIAVGGVADSGLVLRLTRSRLWIGLLGCLLVGIVALNVLALSFNAAASKTAATADELRRENSALTAQIADQLSNERLQAAAARLGLVVPEPGAILYLTPSPRDAAAAAARLRKGDLALGTTYVPAAPVVTATTTTAPVAAPEEAAPVAAEPDPTATEPMLGPTGTDATAAAPTIPPEGAPPVSGGVVP